MKRINLLFLIFIFSLLQCVGKNKSETNNTELSDTESGVITLNEEIFNLRIYDLNSAGETLIYLGDKPAIIDFYADWCAPCKKLAPIMTELAKEYSDDIYIYKINVDKEKGLAGSFAISSIPTMIFIPMKGQPRVSTGFATKAEIDKIISEFLLKK